MSKRSLSRLIDRYLAGKATPQEESLLTGLYESMQQEQHWDEGVLGNAADVEAAVFTRLQQAIESKKKEKAMVKRMPRNRVVSVAAAILLLTITGVVIFMYSPRKSREQITGSVPVENDLAPGGNRAILKLANGQTILLDSAANGLLASEGSTSVLKTGDGQLVYDNTGAGDDAVVWNTLTIPRGGTYAITLADGTRVWLNAGSSLQYPALFKGSERRVILTGEAYFDVVHNSSQPFVVNAAHLQVKDLGTAFNINAYDDEPAIDVTLVSGLAQVINNGKATDLQPGMQARTTGNITRAGSADVEVVTAWKEDKFSFRNAGIQSIMRQVARWYDVEVEIKGTINNKFNGAIYRSTKASNVFKILEETGNVKFIIEGRRVVVMPATN